MKDDVPELPARVPTKRRALERLPDVHIAMWLAGSTITDGERKRLEAVKAERKARPVANQTVGLLVGREGVTPIQQQAIVALLTELEPTEIHHPGVGRSLHEACRRLYVTVHVHRDVRVEESGMREVIKASTVVIGAPKERSRPSKTSVVWDMMRYANHRGLAVKVVLPDGGIHTGLDGT